MEQQQPPRDQVRQKLQMVHPGLFGQRGIFDENAMIVADVIAIVCDGRRYPPRGGTEEFRIPEDISTDIARTSFGVDAYQTRR